MKLVLHAGDYISSFTAKPYTELDVPLIRVFGNNCAETETLRKVYSDVGGDISGYFKEIEAESIKIALLHGHRKQDTDKAYNGDYDVIILGHSHRASISNENDKLVINTGEVCGYISGKHSLGFLNTDNKFAWICELD